MLRSLVMDRYARLAHDRKSLMQRAPWPDRSFPRPLRVYPAARAHLPPKSPRPTGLSRQDQVLGCGLTRTVVDDTYSRYLGGCIMYMYLYLYLYLYPSYSRPAGPEIRSDQKPVRLSLFVYAPWRQRKKNIHLQPQ
jgi:hypothetical protein